MKQNTNMGPRLRTDADKFAAMMKRDIEVLRLIVPPHMITVGCLYLKKLDGELRPDMEERLNNSIVAAMKDLDMLSIARLAKRCDEMVKQLLDVIASDVPTEIILAACFFQLRLVDEGLAPDPGSQATLFALAIKEEAEENQKFWRYDEARIKLFTDLMMKRAKLMALIT